MEWLGFSKDSTEKPDIKPGSIVPVSTVNSEKPYKIDYHPSTINTLRHIYMYMCIFRHMYICVCTDIHNVKGFEEIGH